MTKQMLSIKSGVNCTVSDVTTAVARRDDVEVDGWNGQDAWYEYQVK